MTTLDTRDIQELIEFHKDQNFLKWLGNTDFDTSKPISDKTRFNELRQFFEKFQYPATYSKHYSEEDISTTFEKKCLNCEEPFFNDESDLCDECMYEFDSEFEEWSDHD